MMIEFIVCLVIVSVIGFVLFKRRQRRLMVEHIRRRTDAKLVTASCEKCGPLKVRSYEPMQEFAAYVIFCEGQENHIVSYMFMHNNAKKGGSIIPHKTFNELPPGAK